MSLYKNVGPITYISETQNVQIFSTTQYYVIQIKNYKGSNQISTSMNRIKMLEKLVQKIQQKFHNNNCIKVYLQDQKPPSLLIDKKYIEIWKIQDNFKIQNLCVVCESLINSLQVFNQTKLSGKVQKSMFFINLQNQCKFYLNIGKIHDFSQEIYIGKKQEQQNVNNILKFLNQNFSVTNDVSYKLLLAKLKKCKTFSSMKQQIQYFQRVYEVGAQKLQKQKQNIQTGCLESKFTQLRKNHRLYRKNSEQRQQKSKNKKQSSSSHTSHRQTFQKRQINLLGIGKHKASQSQSIDFFGNSHYLQNSNFPTRNKSSNAIHAGSNSTRYKQNTLRSSKGLFKNNSKSKYKNSVFGSTTNSFHKTAQSSNYFYNKNVTNKFQNSSTISQNMDSKHFDNKYKLTDQKFNNKKQSSILKQPPIINQELINQLVNKNLNKWKEKRNKQVKQPSQKNIKQKYIKQGDKQKSLKRKPKLSGVQFNSITNLKSFGTQSMSSLKNIQQYEKQISKYSNIITSINRLDKNKITEVSQIKQVKPSQIQMINKELIKQLQVKKLKDVKLQKQQKCPKTVSSKMITTNNFKKQKENSRKKIYDEEIQEIKFINRDQVETQRQKNQVKTNKKQKTKQNIKNENENENENLNSKDKQRTARKNQESNCSQLSKFGVKQLNIIQKQINKIDFVGQCVTKVPKFIKQIQKHTDNKYLWQLPTFLLYKQFYFQRLNILDKLKQILLRNSQGKQKNEQLIKYISQFEQQNNLAKESLIKLMKAASKKLKQYQIDTKILQIAKSCLNINQNIKISNMKRLNQISLDFINQIDQVRKQYPQIIQFQIQIIDAYIITKGGQFNIDERNLIQIKQYQNVNTINYLQKRLELCGIQNN